jgi:hypothetical protein
MFFLALTDSKGDQVIDLAAVESENEVRIDIIFYSMHEIRNGNVASSVREYVRR